MAPDVRCTVEAVWRIESAKIVAALARMVRDVGTAEDLAQDVLVTALEKWPRTGMPDNPGAWLMAAAKRRAIDGFRRRRRKEKAERELGRDLELKTELTRLTAESSIREEIEDDLLRLIFTVCHPLLPAEGRVALTLRALVGLTSPEIARAFLVSETTVAQRIVRAKRTLREAQVPFEVPSGPDLAPRLASVLEVIYLIFNEGYASTAGEDWIRPELCEDALRMGRVLAALASGESEVHGLVALMELQSSRLAARVGPGGEPILLLEQDRMRWDRLLIRRGLAALERARERARERGGPLGPYALQASIAACHAVASKAEETDWARIAALYDGLVQLLPSPVVALNRAVSYAMAYGAEAGLELVDELVGHPALQAYHLLPSVRGDFLAKLGRCSEAETEFLRAASLTRNGRERKLLLERAASCAGS